jgi:proliferating cell nuclear antigen PCNA
MKDGRIFEYTVQHISVFKNLFEVLAGVLHEVEIIHIKPEKPVDAEKDDTSDEETENNDSDTDSKNSDESDNESNNDNGSNSDSNSDSKTNIKKSSKKQSNEKKYESESDNKTITKTTNNKIQKANNEKKGGIKIVEINDFESIVIILKLDAINFFKFDCKKPTYSIGLDPSIMFNILKNIEKDDQMTVFVNEANKQYLNIELQNGKKKCKSSYDFKLMDLDERKISPIPPEFDILIEMKTVDFHNVCKELSTFSQFMIVECTDKKIEFKCKGNICNTKKEFEHDPDGDEGTVNIKLNPNRKKNEPIIIREIYDLNDICMFQKCKSISVNMQILLKNENLMFIRYFIASYGTMTVGFNPANEKLVDKHANYDGNKFDPFYKTTEVKYKS